VIRDYLWLFAIPPYARSHDIIAQASHMLIDCETDHYRPSHYPQQENSCCPIHGAESWTKMIQVEKNFEGVP
jgi:hypothetical protein